MAVNKGEIGIYGVLRRDGGDGVLANADQIYDVQLSTNQYNINSTVHTISNEFKVYDKSILIGNNCDNIRLLLTGMEYEPILYLSTKNVYIKNPQGKNLLRSGEISDKSIYLGNKDQNIIVLSSDIQVNSISFGHESSIYDDNKLTIYANTPVDIHSNSSIVLNSDNLSYITTGSNPVLRYDVATNVLYLGNNNTPCSLFINEDGTNIRLSSSINNIKYNLSVATRSIESLNSRCESVERSLTNLVDNVSTELEKKYDSTTSRTQNTVLAAPTTSNGAATFRKLELSDIPNLSSKYQVLDQNGFQQSPSIGGALIGYKNNNGYIKASIPSDRNEEVSSNWYYATDGSLQDINTKVTKLNGPKNDTLNVDFTQYTEDPTRYVQTTVQLYGYYSVNKPDNSDYLNPNVLVTYFAGKHNSTTGYGHQMAYSMSGNTFRRICKLNVWQDWKQFAYTDSDITGNSATATKLKTPVTIWGQSFDGSNNVSGVLEMNGSKLSLGKNTNGNYELYQDGDALQINKFGIGYLVNISESGMFVNGSLTNIRKATERLEVNGNVKSKEYLLSDGSKYAEQCLDSDITALFN